MHSELEDTFKYIYQGTAQGPKGEEKCEKEIKIGLANNGPQVKSNLLLGCVSFTGTQSHPFVYNMSAATFVEHND